MAEKKYRSIDEITHNGKPLREILHAHRTWLESVGKSGSIAELSEANLRWAELSGVDLSKADLSWANLCDADLIATGLSGADLGGAILSGADLSDADLSGANLIRADLSWANLRGANLNKANLNECGFGYTVVADCDLSGVSGLKTVTHLAPSSIGVDTILKSQGKIPEAFLKGAGIPDIWIEYSKSLIANPIEFYSCFLSHSSEDQEFVQDLLRQLRDGGVRCWDYRKDAHWGKPVQTDIGLAIYNFDKIVVVCSASSLNNAKVIDEIQRAIQREDSEKKEILFPIRIDEYLFGDWANKDWEVAYKPRLTKYWVGDFTNWKNPASYSESLDRLVKALNRKQTADS